LILYCLGAVVLGGDNPLPTSGPSTQGRDKQLCQLIECLLRPEALGRFLSEHHIAPNVVRECIESWCKARLGGLSEEEISEREGTSSPPQPAGGPAGPLLHSEIIAVLTNMLNPSGEGIDPVAAIRQAIRVSTPVRLAEEETKDKQC
jgi:hypothetical protein